MGWVMSVTPSPTNKIINPYSTDVENSDISVFLLPLV